MINLQDSIRYCNVISKSYYLYYKDMEDALQDFESIVIRLQLHKNGPVFYSINNVPIDEKLNIEIFMPVVEDFIEDQSEITFHSYYSVENMLSTTLWKNIEENTELSYSALIEFMILNHFKQTTPFYHIISGNKKFTYVQIKVGYTVSESEDNIKNETELR